ncbi:MAG: hypothetical protein U0837_16345 [Dehalococcoidia bacterium]
MHPRLPRTALPVGRHSNGALALIALFALLIVSLAALPSCGGDDDDGSDSGTSSAATTAADLTPDLSSKGLTITQSGKAAGSTQNQDAFTAQFAGPTGAGKVVAARTDVNLHPTVDAATQQYGAISEALRNPPPDLFGPNATQDDNAPVFQADQVKSYKTAKTDVNGTRVYTDAYRMGRAVVIVYVIGPDGAETDAVRKLAAQKINEKAPR